MTAALTHERPHQPRGQRQRQNEPQEVITRPEGPADADNDRTSHPPNPELTGCDGSKEFSCKQHEDIHGTEEIISKYRKWNLKEV